jgi:hypothetical protein
VDVHAIRHTALIKKEINMLSNKILSDKPLAGNENRAHIHQSGRYQEMMPMPAGGGVAGNVRGAGPNDLPPSIRPDAPLNSDPHRNLRGSHQNLTNKPADKNRSAEPGRRIYSRDTTYKY